MNHTLRIAVPRQFHFRNTIYSHGWCGLPPFSIQYSPLRLTIPLRSSRRVFRVIIYPDRNKQCVVLETDRSPGKNEARDLRKQVRAILNLELDLQPFYTFARGVRGFEWISRRKAGRMLRAPTVFEDVVKMILTTNCTWSLTTTMCTKLVRYCSDEESAFGAFPPPSDIASRPERFLRETVKLGYRAPYIRELALRVVSGDLDLEILRKSRESTEVLYGKLRGIKGVGEYAAGNLLKLLGRFDRLGLDSWCRGQFATLHGEGRRQDDLQIAEKYKEFGSWQGLALWLDLTREWYENKFPGLT